MTKAVNLHIADRKLTIGCPDGKEHELQECAQILERRLHNLKERTDISMMDQLSLTAALNLVHELEQYKTEFKHYRQIAEVKIRNLQQELDRIKNPSG